MREKVLFIVILAGLGSWSFVSIASAQAMMTLTPSAITISAVQGEKLTRNIVLQSSEVITNVQVISTDLLNPAGDTVLDASAIQASLAITQTRPGEALTIPVEFDFSLAPVGEFHGDVLILHSQGTITLPVTANVKGNWFMPFILLAVGVVCGVTTTVYRAKGRPHDQVLVRIGHIRGLLRSDRDLPDAFKDAINSSIFDAETALQGEKWDDAALAMDQAERIWQLWKRQRHEWVEQLNYLASLEEGINNFEDTSASTVQLLLQNVKNIRRTLSKCAEAYELTVKLQELANQVNQYKHLVAEVNTLNGLRHEFSGEQENLWRQKILALERKLSELDLTQTELYQSSRDEITSLKSAMETALREASTEASEASKDIGRGFEDAFVDLVAPAPRIDKVSTTKQGIKQAGWRLKAYVASVYVIVILSLASSGFIVLYLNNQTFGASLLDYLALLAWGFAVDPTRLAIYEGIKKS
jgi:hypothetical protein